MVKNAANVGNIRDAGLIPGLGRSSGKGHCNPLQHSCLENPMDRGARQAIVHRVTKSWTRLKRLSIYAGTQTIFKSPSSLREKKKIKRESSLLYHFSATVYSFFQLS